MARFRIRQDGLAAHVYDNDVLNQDKPIAIFCPGLPYEAREEAVTHELVRRGWQVLQIQYLGTYDSDGDFTPESSIQTVAKARTLLGSGSFIDHKSGDRFSFSVHRPVIIGHSFGAWVALRSLENESAPASCCVFAPFLGFGNSRPDNGVKCELDRHVSYMAAAMPHTIRFRDTALWNDFFTSANDTEWIYTDVPAGSHVLLIVGEDDQSFDLKRLQEKTTLIRSKSAFSLELLVATQSGHSPEEMFDKEAEWATVINFLQSNG